MPEFKTAHETLVFERTFTCTLDVLYRAFADPEARARWGRPSPKIAVIYDQTEFKVGGVDKSRCGPQENPKTFVEALYFDIQPHVRIVYSERVSEDGEPLSAALHTVEFAQEGPTAHLKLTVQVASLAGADMARGVRQGFSAALKNLTRELGG